MAGDSQLITREHLVQINNALDVIDSIKYEIDRAKRAGIDVSTLEQQLKDREDQLRKIKQVYFPNG